MATLQGTKIKDTYTGILKTDDNIEFGAADSRITTGEGTQSPLSLSTTRVKIDSPGIGGASLLAEVDSAIIKSDNVSISDASQTIGFGITSTAVSFGGPVDFSAATVTGLPAGASGLESGAGADSMQSSATLTTTGANAAGDRSISLGDGSVSRDADDVVIGPGAQSQTDGAGGKIAIGHNANASHEYGISIGENSKGHYQGIAIGRGASNGTIGGGVALGKSAQNSANNGTALGTLASTTATGASAIGYGVTAAITDTVSVKALEVQTDSTPTAGGIIMSDAGGTDRRLNIDASGALQIDSTPVGGGGGGQERFSFKNGLQPGMSNQGWNLDAVYNSPWITTGYSKVNTAVPNSVSIAIPFYAKAGATMGAFQFEVGVAGNVTDIALYKSYEHTSTDGSKWLMPEYIDTIASNVDISTNGYKNITGLNIPFEADSVDGVYWVVFTGGGSDWSLRRWANPVWTWNFTNDIYRTNGAFIGTTTINTGQITSFTGGTTDASVIMGWKYI